MECANCGHDSVADAKFCTECGAKLERCCTQCGAAASAQSKFCTQCGAKLPWRQGKAEQAKCFEEVPSIPLSRLAADVSECVVTIHEVTAEGPDDGGELTITVHADVKNDTDDDWALLGIRAQVFDAGGRVVGEARDSLERAVSPGNSLRCRTGVRGIKAKVLGPRPEHSHVVVSVVACGMSELALGDAAVPYEAFRPVALRAGVAGEVLSVMGSTVWRTDPDKDKDAQFEVKLLVQNLTARRLPKVCLVVDVADKTGTKLLDATACDEVQPGAICVVGTSGYVHDMQLTGGKVSAAVRAYWPSAAGVSQTKGMAISASGIRPDPNSQNFSGANVEGVSGMQRFYANMKWFDAAEQPDDITDLPPEFGQAKALWDEDRMANSEQILRLLSTFVGARFIPINISGWEELFVDDEGDGLIEIEATDVKVTGIDFGRGPLPICKAEAGFQVPVTDAFAATDLEGWQDENASFTDAVVFYWNVPRTDQTEDLDFTAGDNQGVECVACT